jgi:hypothetical protein
MAKGSISTSPGASGTSSGGTSIAGGSGWSACWSSTTVPSMRSRSSARRIDSVPVSRPSSSPSSSLNDRGAGRSSEWMPSRRASIAFK